MIQLTNQELQKVLKLTSDSLERSSFRKQHISPVLIITHNKFLKELEKRGLPKSKIIYKYYG